VEVFILWFLDAKKSIEEMEIIDLNDEYIWI
jgi:hypothetical protein